MTLPELFDAFNRLRVLIIGDVMLDRYVWGRVERISPEAPVPVVLAHKKECRLGGAGNVVLNVAALGARAVICSVVGEDRDGTELVELLESNGLSSEGILKSADRMTTVKERVIAGSQQVVRVDSETDRLISEADRQALLARIEALLDQTDVVIFEDYDKGVISPELIAAVVERTRQRGIPTVVDPKKRNFLHCHGVTLFKPNLKELREGLNVSVDVKNPVELEAAAARLRERLGTEGTLITLSERGVFIDLRDERHHLPAHVRQIADVSGAGDTVISIAACGLALGLSPRQIAGLSNLGGGLVCESVGVVPIDKRLLLEEALREGI
jgi:rfaE bifunctional protein kinase chain/domain